MISADMLLTTNSWAQQQARRICENVQRKDFFTMSDGQIIFHNSSSNNKKAHFEINMVEEIIREVCTMYNRRIRLYEPIVNSLMDRVSNDTFSPSALYKLVPVKDSLQRFGGYEYYTIQCVIFRFTRINMRNLLQSINNRDECQGRNQMHN